MCARLTLLTLMVSRRSAGREESQVRWQRSPRLVSLPPLARLGRHPRSVCEDSVTSTQRAYRATVEMIASSPATTDRPLVRGAIPLLLMRGAARLQSPLGVMEHSAPVRAVILHCLLPFMNGWSNHPLQTGCLPCRAEGEQVMPCPAVEAIVGCGGGASPTKTYGLPCSS